MKKLFVLISLFASFVAHAQNPQIRNCNSAGGQFLVADVHMGAQSDQIGLCLFNTALVGALDVMSFLDSQKAHRSASFTEYQNKIAICSGSITTLHIINSNLKIQACVYADKSIIDLETLAAGQTSPENAQLNAFLGLSF